MRVAELGEFGLIALLARLVAERGLESGSEDKPTAARLEIGIGDDAAVWYTKASHQLGTTDTLVEGVHFTLDTATWYELGWKALAVNISDIAAMGGIPLYALVTLGLPLETEVDNLEQLYVGMLDIGQQYRVRIAGGDIVRAPVVVISVALFGTAIENKGSPYNILRRAAAFPGDLVAVTGYLGTSAAGLRMIKSKKQLDHQTQDLLRQAHFRPQPRIEEGQLLATLGVVAAMDISDGLADDLAKLCQASGVGARLWVDKVPVHPLVRAAFPQDFMQLALAGGEDYELLFTAKREAIERVQRAATVPITTIGEIVAEPVGQVRLLTTGGEEWSLGRGGWDHFLTVTPSNE